MHELGQRANDLDAELLARFGVTHSMLETGDRDGARLHATAMLKAAESLRHRTFLFSALMMLGLLSRLEGDWQTAHRFLDRALEGNPDSRQVLVNKMLVYYEVGETKEGDTWLERFMKLSRDDSGPFAQQASVGLAWALLVSRITGIAGDLDMAERTAQAALATPEGRRPREIISARTGLALLAVHRSDAEAAAEQYQALRSRQIQWIASDRLLGLLAHTMGKLDDAAGHFEDALDFCRKAGYRPELAWTFCDYADTLHERGGDGDRGRAVSLLDESLAISRDLGMRSLMERVLSRREHLEA